MLIERCTFDTGDDCIAIKSGRNDDGRRVDVPVENIVVRDCVMKDGHGGVDDRQRDLRRRAQRLRRALPDGQPAARSRAALQDQLGARRRDRARLHARRHGRPGRRGGRRTPTSTTRKATPARFTPMLRDVEVRNVTSQKSRYALLLRGYAHAPITDVRVIDCTFDGVAEPDVLEGVRGPDAHQHAHQRHACTTRRSTGDRRASDRRGCSARWCARRRRPCAMLS